MPQFLSTADADFETRFVDLLSAKRSLKAHGFSVTARLTKLNG
jgi:hypothetical protein